MHRLLTASLAAAALGVIAPLALHAQQAPAAREITFTKDVAPILQRSCENCHRPDGVAPMSLVNYEDVRPWARAIKQRTSIGPKAGVMPPWYVEKNIGIQKFQSDPSLSEDEIALIAKWADSGAPRGNPADMPPPKVYSDRNAWAIGTPDLVVKTNDILVKGNAPVQTNNVCAGFFHRGKQRGCVSPEVNDRNTRLSHSPHQFCGSR